MTVDHPCDICENPAGESAYVCLRCTDAVRRFLQDAELAGEVETTVALQARYADGVGQRPQPADDDPDVDGGERRPLPVRMHGWSARKSKPPAGALRPTRLPYNDRAAARSADAFNALTTWARIVLDERGGELPQATPGEHPAALAARFLLGELEWTRHQRFAAEAFSDLRQAGGAIRQIVDSPAEREIVGGCECGRLLYAYKGAATVTCRECGVRQGVPELRENLMRSLRGYYVTVAEAVKFAVIAYPDMPRKRITQLIESYVRPDRVNHLMAHEHPDGPLYLFAEVIDRLTRSVARLSEKDHANVSAI